MTARSVFGNAKYLEPFKDASTHLGRGETAPEAVTPPRCFKWGAERFAYYCTEVLPLHSWTIGVSRFCEFRLGPLDACNLSGIGH